MYQVNFASQAVPSGFAIRIHAADQRTARDVIGEGELAEMSVYVGRARCLGLTPSEVEQDLRQEFGLRVDVEFTPSGVLIVLFTR